MDAETQRINDLTIVLEWLTAKANQLPKDWQDAFDDRDTAECDRITSQIVVGHGWYTEIQDERLAIVTRQRADADRKLQTWQRAVTP